ncbi:unnamed protein product [Brassicogethes aeneus]|uniref:glutathione transferase n=1 Tax=Brassicogethes aeneus TaxID=1431903 RepID=A0A9P0BFB5_BRAAE|nr:unnamed protein product [Brassicogethes aeneus]
MTYKLTYFDIPGLGEPIRWMFAMGKIEFEDIHIKKDDWSTFKPETPFGQLPLLEHNGKVVSQSMAICRYVGKLVGLGGKDAWEDLEIDFMVDCFSDFTGKLIQMVKETDEARKEELKKTVNEELIPFYLNKFEERTKTNKGYLVGGHLTWADVVISCLLKNFEKFTGGSMIENHPGLKKIQKEVLSNPEIKKHIESHSYTNFVYQFK